MRQYSQPSIDKYRYRPLANSTNRNTDSVFHNILASKSQVPQSHPYFNRESPLEHKKSDTFGKSGMKRGVNIGVHVNIPTTTQAYVDSLEKLEGLLEKALIGRVEKVNASDCPKCGEEEEMPEFPVKYVLI